MRTNRARARQEWSCQDMNIRTWHLRNLQTCTEEAPPSRVIESSVYVPVLASFFYHRFSHSFCVSLSSELFHGLTYNFLKIPKTPARNIAPIHGAGPAYIFEETPTKPLPRAKVQGFSSGGVTGRRSGHHISNSSSLTRWWFSWANPLLK